MKKITNRKIHRFSIALVFAFSLLELSASANLPPASKVIRLEKIGRVHLGDSIENFPLISGERKRFNSRGHRARLSFFFFHPSFPSHCMNLQCGVFARQIVARGGLLIGGTRESYAQEIGAEDDSGQSLLFVTDDAGLIRGIYRNVSTEDVRQILKDQNGDS